jgi:hypothetical protein
MAKPPINYTSRDYASIRNDLVNYAKRYYPTTFKDFSEASFGAMMMDMVAYVGDQLSFYADFQTNETFLDSAIRFENVLRLSNILGYKTVGAAQSTGQVALYVTVPANSLSRGPDLDYFPILKAGTLIGGGGGVGGGGAIYTLVEDVDFTNPNNQVTVANVDNSTGNPTYFAIKAYGTVISGQKFRDIVTIGDYLRFREVRLKQGNVSEVLSVIDSQGNEYYQVDYLTQDVVMKQVKNINSDRIAVPYVMKLIPAPRRFVTSNTYEGNTFIQFGYGSEANLTSDVIADPADVVLDVTGRDYITDTTFDPGKLIQTDKFGVVPTNTTLTIEYIANNTSNVNAAAGTLSSVVNPQFSFRNQGTLNSTLVAEVQGSLEVDNEEPILGDTEPLLPDEVRERAFGTYAAQNRAVTRSDYINLVYRMPSKFGKVFRCNVVRDMDSLKRNLNVYLMSQNTAGDLVVPNSTLKENVKTWLNRYRMINDTIDVLEGRVINIGINFRILPALDVNRYQLLQDCVQKLQDEYINVKFNVGEAVYISEIYKLLNDVPGVVDTTNVELVNKSGGVYSDVVYNIDSNLSDDGRFLLIPEDAVAEVLVPGADISGVVT